MTAVPSIDPARFLNEHLAQASPDLMRELLSTFIQTLLSADADAVCGAGYGLPSPERTNTRNGYRHRDLDTRVGTIDVAIPKLRSGTYFPDWLLQRRRRAEAALTSVVATCYLLGVSTRRMDRLVQSLGITGLSRSQVSEMAKDLDAHVNDFRTRPLDAGPYTFLAADALMMKVREGGRVINVAVLVATGVNADGHREILGVQVSTAETGAGVVGVLPRPGRPRPVRSRAGHLGCARRPGRGDRRDAARGQLAEVSHALRGQPDVGHPEELVAVGQGAAALRLRPARQGVRHEQFDRILDALTDKLPTVAEHLDGARGDVLAFTAFPKEIWRQIWSNNPNERLNREIRRRTDVVGIFPDRTSIIRLVGAVLAEQNDEWAEARRYLGLDALAKARLTLIADPEEEPATITALSA